MREWQTALEAGLAQLGEPCPEETATRFTDVLEQLQRWNRTYNLTAIDEPVEMVSHHLMDSLSLLPWLPGNCRNLLDIGTGAGFPAIPLAIMRPQLQVTALDAVAKKLRFISHIKRRLQLDNLTPVHGRIEDYAPPSAPEIITARALASLPQLHGWTRDWLAAGATLLAMKGRRPHQELASLAGAGLAVDVHALDVPGLPAQRHLVIITDPDSE